MKINIFTLNKGLICSASSHFIILPILKWLLRLEEKTHKNTQHLPVTHTDILAPVLSSPVFQCIPPG